MKNWKLLFLKFLILILAPTALAQEDCPPIVRNVLDSLGEICGTTGNGEACYGNTAINAIPHPDVVEFKFEDIGDIATISAIQSIRMSGLDTLTNAWGVALLRVQARVAGVVPGEAVTFLLFGNVELLNAVAPDDEELAPMQAFYLRTEIGDAACAEAPESGLLIRTPEGLGEVSFAINGVNVTMGSDVYIQAQPEGDMILKTFNGSLTVETEDGVSGAVAGMQVSVPMDENLQPAAPPEPAAAYTEENTQLPEEVFGEVAPPLSDEQVEEFNEILASGGAACGSAPFLPDCSGTIRGLGGTKCPINDAGQPDCTIVNSVEWTEVTQTEYGVVTVWDQVPGTDLDSLGGVSTSTPEPISTPEPTAELPPGCYAGICLQDAAVACQCVLCGVACPVPQGNATDSGSTDSGGTTGGNGSNNSSNGGTQSNNGGVDTGGDVCAGLADPCAPDAPAQCCN